MKATFNSIRDTFIREDSMNVELFKFFGEWLFLNADLSEHKSTLRTIFKFDVLQDEDCRIIIHKYKDELSKIYKMANEESEDFSMTLKDIYNSSTAKEIKDIADTIGLSLEENNNQSSLNETNKLDS